MASILWIVASLLCLASGATEKFPEGDKLPEENGTELRLVGAKRDRLGEGRVEIRYNGTWGSICDEDFSVEDASVVCKMLGYQNIRARSIPAKELYYLGTGKIWLDGLSCTGNESSILECNQKGWGNTSCSHEGDVGVMCFNETLVLSTTTTPPPPTSTVPPMICDTPSQEVRLIGGKSESEGQVQVLHDEKWGSVCDDRWDLRDASVVCKMLCYHPHNARAYLGGMYGIANASYHLDNVQCTGEEDNIKDCTHNNWGVHDCSLTEAAGVSCLPEGPLPSDVPEPEILCTEQKITAKFSRQLEQRLSLDHVSLADPAINETECGYKEIIDDDYVQVSVPFVGCGTQRLFNETDIIYTNNIRHGVPSDSEVITRATVFTVKVSCALPRNGDPGNEIQAMAKTAPPQISSGKFDVQMNLYASDRFQTPVGTFPAKLTLGELVYVGMSLHSSDKGLKVIVPTCKVTPTEDPTSEPQYYLIKDNCPQESSMKVYSLNETTYGFRFESFKFLGEFPSIYVHCDAWICEVDEKNQDCDRSCAAGVNKRYRRDVLEVSRETYHVGQGPLMLSPEGKELQHRIKELVAIDTTSSSGALSLAYATVCAWLSLLFLTMY